MTLGNSDPRAYLAVGFVAGIVTFFRGFSVYREYKLIEDTPHVPIASAAMGLVRVQGTAQTSETILSPVSRTPCCFYLVDIQQWTQDSDVAVQGSRPAVVNNEGGHFEPWRTDSSGPRFHIADESGKILVDLHGAKFELEQTGERILDGTSNSIPATMIDLESAVSGEPPKAYVPPSERELQEYVSMTGLTSDAGRMNSRPEDATPQLGSRKEQTRLALLDLLRESGEAEVTSPEGRLDRMRELIEARAASAGPLAEKILEAFKEHNAELLAAAAREDTLQAGEEEYKLIEYCVIPNSTYDIVGTCMDNPDTADPSDHSMIAKGRDDKTFQISCKTAGEVEVELRNRATYMIFGGAALSVVCLYFILSLSHLL
ncbi:MAG: hypothetical protein WAK91_18625 [Candidatus Acidiferrales bacterium]